EAVTIAPNNSATYVNLAALQQKFAAYSEAEANLKKAHTLAPASTVPVMMLGSLFETQKRYDDARPGFQSAIPTGTKNPHPPPGPGGLVLRAGPDGANGASPRRRENADARCSGRLPHARRFLPGPRRFRQGACRIPGSQQQPSERRWRAEDLRSASHPRSQ